MKAIILVAGYATRLLPITKRTPKALLEVNGKPILSYILDDIIGLECIDMVYVVSNHLFFEQFSLWILKQYSSMPINVIDDGTVSNEMRLGAVRDLYLAIEAYNIQDDIFVLAGDNLVDFELKGFVEFFRSSNHDCVMIYPERRKNQLIKTGVAEVKDGKIITFMEKPDNPRGEFAVPPFYIFRKETLPLIKQYVETKQPSDSPGKLVEWLTTKIDIFGYPMPGKRYDVGDIESYEEVKRVFHSFQ